jgi:hypothetical protein
MNFIQNLPEEFLSYERLPLEVSIGAGTSPEALFSTSGVFGGALLTSSFPVAAFFRGIRS